MPASILRFVFALLAAAALGPAVAATVTGTSESVTWSCTGTPCPWGNELSGHALPWPDSEALNSRFGYTVSRGIYLPAGKANGLTLAIDSGSASLYAGHPDDPSHRALATVYQGGSFRIDGLADGEVVSVQASDSFSYSLSPPATSQPSAQSSQHVTWNCTGTPCPWGSRLEGQAIVWPASASPQQTRFGYTTSAPVYLPATAANGMEVELLSGSASVYAGQPSDASHRLIASLSAGSGRVTVTGLASGEVLSVQGAGAFTYETRRSDPSAPGEPVDPTNPPATNSSLYVVWNCTTSPCPWGTPLSGQALVWPSDWLASKSRLGYETSANVYLGADAATGKYITLLTGSASAYAGTPEATSHRLVGSIAAGQTLLLSGLAAGEVVSVQSSEAFTYQFTNGETPTEPTPPGDGTMPSVLAHWRCNIAGCSDNDWVAGVISWPSWSAYESNARSGSDSRSVFSSSGEALYPYMGAWANGCHVTAVSGLVLIIEWQRGTNLWRETRLAAGESHVISLTSPEDGAMIEGVDAWTDFSVKVANCTPQHIR